MTILHAKRFHNNELQHIQLVFAYVHSCSLVSYSCSLVLFSCLLVFCLCSLVLYSFSHLCSVVFTPILLMFTSVHLRSLVFWLVCYFRIDLSYMEFFINSCARNMNIFLEKWTINFFLSVMKLALPLKQILCLMNILQYLS